MALPRVVFSTKARDSGGVKPASLSEGNSRESAGAGKAKKADQRLADCVRCFGRARVFCVCEERGAASVWRVRWNFVVFGAVWHTSKDKKSRKVPISPFNLSQLHAQ